jgi:GntR family transcriptional repressor for pyruvate dehydrogenase complex
MDKRHKISLSNHVKKVRKVRVREEIVSQIRTLIEEGKLQPGDRLPPERELCELFNVSRHSVREALRALERSRMINSIPGSGNYIAMNESDAAKGMIASYLFDKKDELTEIFQIRQIIEPQVARLAARNARKKNLDQLNRLMEKNKALLSQKTIDQKKFSNLDKELHLEIARATQSSIIPKLVERISDLFSESRHESILSESRMKVSCQGHIDLIRAILEKNENNASELMETHLKNVEAEAIRHLVSTTKTTYSGE